MNATIKIDVDIKTETDTCQGKYELDVDFEMEPYDPGNACGPMDSCYPPEGGEIEINQIEIISIDGKTVDFTESENEHCSSLLQKQYSELIEEKCFNSGIEQKDYCDEF